MNYTTKEPIGCKAIKWNGNNLEALRKLLGYDYVKESTSDDDDNDLYVNTYPDRSGWEILPINNWVAVIYLNKHKYYTIQYTDQEFKAKFKPT